MKLEKLDDMLIRRVENGFVIFRIGMSEQLDGTYETEEVYSGTIPTIDEVLDEVAVLLANPSITNETV